MTVIKEIIDYIRFVSIKNKDIVIYSERSVYYKYLKFIIQDILKETDKDVLYISSDENDDIFKNTNKRIKKFYINTLLKPFMQFLDCKIFITSLTELGNYNFQLSKNKDIKYLYIFHAVVSTTMMYKKNAFNNYSAIFCAGPHHNIEIREFEKRNNLAEKTLINYGYPLLNELIKEYKDNKQQHDKPVVLIAPSWHDDNILNTCIYDILNNISEKYDIIIRPHPEYLKRYNHKFINIEKNIKNKNVYFDRDMLSSKSLYTSDILITDWSGISFEYSFASLNPVIFINTPKKVHNEEYDLYENKPIEVTLRQHLGINLNYNEINNIETYIDDFITNYEKYKTIITELRNEYIYNTNSDGIEYIKKLLI